MNPHLRKILFLQSEIDYQQMRLANKVDDPLRPLRRTLYTLLPIWLCAQMLVPFFAAFRPDNGPYSQSQAFGELRHHMDKSPILTDASGQVRAAMVLDAQTESPRVVMTDPEGRVRLRLELAGPNEDPRLVMVGTDGREWQVMSAKGIAIEQIDPTVE